MHQHIFFVCLFNHSLEGVSWSNSKSFTHATRRLQVRHGTIDSMWFNPSQDPTHKKNLVHKSCSSFFFLFNHSLNIVMHVHKELAYYMRRSILYLCS